MKALIEKSTKPLALVMVFGFALVPSLLIAGAILSDVSDWGLYLMSRQDELSAKLDRLEDSFARVEDQLDTQGVVFDKALEKKASEARIAIQTVESRLDQATSTLKESEARLLEALTKTNINVEEVAATQQRIAVEADKRIAAVNERVDKSAVVINDMSASLAQAHSNIFHLQLRRDDGGNVRREVHLNRMVNKEPEASTVSWAFREFDELMADYEWAAREGIYFWDFNYHLDLLKYLARAATEPTLVPKAVTSDEVLGRVLRVVKHFQTAPYFPTEVAQKYLPELKILVEKLRSLG